MELRVVHLPTGQRADTILSPAYQGYGLWNLVDFAKGVAYHRGIGMDPSQHRYGEAQDVYPSGRQQTIENFLIAARIRLPR